MPHCIIVSHLVFGQIANQTKVSFWQVLFTSPIVLVQCKPNGVAIVAMLTSATATDTNMVETMFRRTLAAQICLQGGLFVTVPHDQSESVPTRAPKPKPNPMIDEASVYSCVIRRIESILNRCVLKQMKSEPSFESPAQ